MKARKPICVDLLQRIRLDEENAVIFRNGERLKLAAGHYWTAAFGVVVDLTSFVCIASPGSAWKIDGSIQRGLR